MNLKKFLKYIDDTVSEMSGEQITSFVHEIARTLPERLSLEERNASSSSIIKIEGASRIAASNIFDIFLPDSLMYLLPTLVEVMRKTGQPR